MDMGNDFDRLLFFEHARKSAESAYAINPLDADNLTRWGGALIELSQFQTPAQSISLLQEAASKLEEALTINPKKHDALWCLGNVHTTHAFMIPDIGEATPYFTKAAQYFQQASQEDPANELYQKSMEICAKAPELHAEIHKHSLGQAAAGGGPSTSTSSKTSAKKISSDLKYDIMGWVILAVGIVVWLGYSKNHLPPPPPPPPR